MNELQQSLSCATAATVDQLLAQLPQLLGAVALLLVGWMLEWLLRLATRRAAALLDSLITRSTGQARWRVGRSAMVLGRVVNWVVLLFFAAAATHTLGLQTFTDWLARLLEHLPALAAGLLISWPR